MAVGNAGDAPLITTIIPTFRRPRLLRRAIMSALEQEGVPLQVCVYDNSSGDETSEVVAEIASQDPRLNYYCHPVNIGGAANFEYGMCHVDTPFFSFLSDDDYLLPGFYQRALASLDSYPQALCWAGMTLCVDENDGIWHARVHDWPREGLFTPPDGFMRMTAGMAPTWTAILFRREILDRVGTLDMEMLGVSDLEYCLRLASRFPYVLEKHPSAVFTLNGESFSATQPMSSFWPGWQRMIKRFESEEPLDDNFRKAAVAALRRDAQRMLFRRGANAIAARRLGFARDAADALDAYCGLKGRARLLRVIASGCEHNVFAQRIYTRAYRMAEWRIVRSRSALQKQYGRLLRPV